MYNIHGIPEPATGASAPQYGRAPSYYRCALSNTARVAHSAAPPYILQGLRGPTADLDAECAAARTASRFWVSGPAALEKRRAAGEKVRHGTLDLSRGFSRGPPAGRRGFSRLRCSGSCLRRNKTNYAHGQSVTSAELEVVVDCF
ncbi:hypothetical protein NDU88_001443 [Pleurodeles waltl]|uniref:Uncharacterized protein n=1 Tax=Pleurodeles waltl TaxID=8319 RepID=A0AAV7NJ17_PLEWA|nr:hypothetical protein NDU88_001443 [Pleurodeles waltl]